MSTQHHLYSQQHGSQQLQSRNRLRPSTEKWTNKVWDINKTQYCPPMERKVVGNTGNITLSQRSQTQEDSASLQHMKHLNGTKPWRQTAAIVDAGSQWRKGKPPLVVQGSLSVCDALKQCKQNTKHRIGYKYTQIYMLQICIFFK